MRFDYYLLITASTREIKGEFDTITEAKSAAWIFGEDTYYILGYSKSCGYIVVMNTEEIKKLFEEGVSENENI